MANVEISIDRLINACKLKNLTTSIKQPITKADHTYYVLYRCCWYMRTAQHTPRTMYAIQYSRIIQKYMPTSSYLYIVF